MIQDFSCQDYLITTIIQQNIVVTPNIVALPSGGFVMVRLEDYKYIQRVLSDFSLVLMSILGT